MAFEERDQSGSLFKNARKEKDSHPDYQGKAIVNGQPVYISAWLKDGPKGKYMSLAFKNRQEGGFKSKEPEQPSDDEIPF